MNDSKSIIRQWSNRASVRVEIGRLYLFSISFSLLFSFPFIFILEARVRDEYNSVLHISHCHTVTQSCVMMKDGRRFWKDDIIQYINLKINIWLFKTG